MSVVSGSRSLDRLAYRGDEPRFTHEEWSRIVQDPTLDKTYLELQLGQPVGRYLSWKRNEDGAKGTTIRDYESVLARLCVYVPKTADEVTVADLRYAREQFIEGQRYKAGSVFRDFFRWLYEEGDIDANPAGRLRLGVKPKKPITDLYTDAEKAAIVAAQEDPMDRVGVLLIFRAGLRKNELRELLVRDVNLVDKHVLVRRGKGEKSRIVPIKGQTVRAIDELLLTPIPGHDRTRTLDEYLLCPLGGGRSTRRVPSRPMSARGLHEWWYGCLRRAGLVDKGVSHGRRMHAGRHTYATDLGRATGWNMVAVQKNLGHASIAQTVDTYTQFALEDQAEAVGHLPEIEVA